MRLRVVRLAIAGLALVGMSLSFSGLPAQSDAPSESPYASTVAKAVEYLRSTGQAPDGSFSAQAGPAVTALVTSSLIAVGRPADDPAVAKGLKYVESFIQPDGGIYQSGSYNTNYETAIAMMCLAGANSDGRYAKQLAAAEAFIKGLQWDEGEGVDPSHVNYGGGGYGRSKRPDLSNTAFLLEALKSVGRGPDDEAVKRALIFVSRCQNLESEHNTTEFAAKNPDGGFYYTPAAGGTSQAGPTPQGGLRSYGSMTYAGLKSMIHAGVGPNDPRVAAAVRWIGQNYGLQENPGMGDAGLFYYYHTFAKALAAIDANEFEDARGAKHDWRRELVTHLADTQRADGSWVNANSRWLEGDPNLVTAYALLALSYCKPEAK